MTKEKFCKLLKEAIEDEAKADAEYAELIQTCKEAWSRSPDCDKIIPIRRDENIHEDVLRGIYRRKCQIPFEEMPRTIKKEKAKLEGLLYG